MLYKAIALYQRSRTVQALTRLGVAAHHTLRRPQTRPCPHKANGASCSAYFANMAKTQGGLAAGVAALTAMSRCGPNEDSSCWDKRVDIDSMEWCIRIGTSPVVGDCWTSKPSPVSCPDSCLSVESEWCAPKPDDIC